jgi:hypothetical protein
LLQHNAILFKIFTGKSLATSGFAGAYPARQGIYTLSPETALLLRNKSTAKGVIYYGSLLLSGKPVWIKYRLPLLTLRKKHCREKGCRNRNSQPERIYGLAVSTE